MIKNKIHHETSRFVSVKYASSREKNDFSNKIIISTVLVSGSILMKLINTFQQQLNSSLIIFIKYALSHCVCLTVLVYV